MNEIIEILWLLLDTYVDIHSILCYSTLKLEEVLKIDYTDLDGHFE